VVGRPLEEIPKRSQLGDSICNEWNTDIRLDSSSELSTFDDM